MRKKVYIVMSDVRDIMAFADIASKVDGDVDVQRGRTNIDGSSLMGLYAVDMSQGVAVEYPEDATEFETFITPFIVQG